MSDGMNPSHLPYFMRIKRNEAERAMTVELVRNGNLKVQIVGEKNGRVFVDVSDGDRLIWSEDIDYINKAANRIVREIKNGADNRG